MTSPSRDLVELGHTVEEGSEGPSHVWSFRVPEDLVYFQGHFPHHPVLPAVTQLEAMVLRSVGRTYAGLGTLRRANRLKFVRPVGPGDALALRLRRTDDRVVFRVERAGDLVTSGILVFDPA
ncbi:MAG: 3-hydroxyacyl-ACP dehydratase FabZ family protein [Myxococcota bacterium]